MLPASQKTTPEGFEFPRGFLWGAATASHQVEGNNRHSDWWEFEQAGRLPHASGDACRHYDLFEQDFDLARSWGHNAHRLSIEWSRIEPAEGQWNPDEIEHYREVIQALRQRNLEPIVTLHHFTNPSWFLRRGGWLESDSPKRFARFVAYAVERLGSDITFWITINEPTVYVKRSYVTGIWPPCATSPIRAARVLLNLARAHVAAYRIVHGLRPRARVSFAHSAPLVVPRDPRHRSDRIAAGIHDFLLNRLFFVLIGASGKRGSLPRNLDFVGVNYYTRHTVRSRGLTPRGLLGESCGPEHHPDPGAMNSMGWEIYPPGLEQVLRRFSRYGLPLLITENGVATDDEALRRSSLLSHLKSVARALDGGLNIIGYIYWTLIDNYEWTHGTEARYGLAEVDFETQKRVPRPCAEAFARICRENRLLVQ